MSCEFVTQLSKLRKLSAESVENTKKFDPFKEYLHVERQVEKELRELLRDINDCQGKCLVLLCGSAGDGKSHLISFLKNSDSEQLLADYEPYNDATESAEPTMTSIETLAEKLSPFNDENYCKDDGKRMIVAINLGTLNNFIDSEKSKNFSVLKEFVLSNDIISGFSHSTGYKENSTFQYVIKHLQQLGFEVDYVDPERDGRILPEKVFGLLRKDTLLVSIMHVNNETGAVQPVQEVGDYLLDKDVFFHVDATQSFGKLVDELRFLKYDMLSMSAHKLGGPQGIGALILRKKRYKLPPVKNIMYGGPQEHGIRPGTTPVALVAGLGKACELAATEYKKNAERCCTIRNCILQLLKESGISYRINGDLQYCIHNTLNMCFDGVSSEALMLATKQYCGISNGSACNSHSYSPSYVLTAMGLPEERIESSIRVSWGPLTDIQLVEIEFGRLLEYVKSIQ